MNTVVEVHKLHKSYANQRVVDDLSLNIKRGECYGLLGPNGAGKTTTLRLLLGLTAPDGGTVKLLDLPCPPMRARRGCELGVVPQIDNLDPDFTVAENLLVYGRYFGMSDAEIDARIPDAAGIRQPHRQARCDGADASPAA